MLQKRVVGTSKAKQQSSNLGICTPTQTAKIMPRSSMFMQARDGSYPGMNFSSRSLSLSLSLKKNRVRDVTFGHVVSKMWFTFSFFRRMRFEIQHVELISIYDGPHL